MPVKINLSEVVDSKAEKIFGKAKFQRRHYVLLADILASVDDEKVRRNIANKLNVMFSEDNELYRPNMFLKRCNLS